MLAPGVENKGAVSSRAGPTVPDDDESRRGSMAPFRVLSIEEVDALERGIWGAQPVDFSTHGGDSATSGAGVGSDCSADCTVDPTKRLRLFIPRNFDSLERKLRFVLGVAVLGCPQTRSSSPRRQTSRYVKLDAKHAETGQNATRVVALTGSLTLSE